MHGTERFSFMPVWLLGEPRPASCMRQCATIAPCTALPRSRCFHSSSFGINLHASKRSSKRIRGSLERMFGKHMSACQMSILSPQLWLPAGPLWTFQDANTITVARGLTHPYHTFPPLQLGLCFLPIFLGLPRFF